MKNDFKYWRCSRKGKHILRSAEKNSLREMYLSDTPIGRELQQITKRADNGGCGERRGEGRPGGGGDGGDDGGGGDGGGD